MREIYEKGILDGLKLALCELERSETKEDLEARLKQLEFFTNSARLLEMCVPLQK